MTSVVIAPRLWTRAARSPDGEGAGAPSSRARAGNRCPTAKRKARQS